MTLKMVKIGHDGRHSFRPYRSVESRVFNFSFGCFRADPIRFSWRSAELAALAKYDVEF
jgi:hypothetical protein